MSNDESSSGVPVKTYTHVPPRIDPEWYQAEIPYPCRGPLPPEAVQTDWFDATRKVYSNDESKDAKKNFLLHTRNLFERRKLGVSRQVGDEPPVVWKKEHVSFPLESDEAAIEFLAKHDYDLNKAKFYLACILSGGRDVVHARRMRQQLAKTPSASVTQRLETIFLDHNHVWMHGAYANHSGTGEYITDASGDNLLFLPDFGTGEVETPNGSSSVSRCYSQLQSDIDSSINVHKYEVDVFSREESVMSAGGHGRRKMQNQESTTPGIPVAQVTSNDNFNYLVNGEIPNSGNEKPQRDKSITDKALMKKKWSHVGKNIAALVTSVKSAYGGVSRSSLDTVHEHLTAAFVSLPIPSDIVLGMDLYAQLHDDIPKVVENYVMCKEWVGEVYDMLCPLALVTNDMSPCDYKKLKQLLVEGEGLPFRCVYEENQLKRVLKDMEELVVQGTAVINDATESASSLAQNYFDNHLSSGNDEETTSGSNNSNGGNRSRSKANSKASKRNLSEKDRDDLKLSNLLASDMQSFNEDRIDIYHLNSILLSFSCLPHNISNLPENFTCQWEGAAVPRTSDTPTYPNCSACFSSLAPSLDGKTMASHWDSLFLAQKQKRKIGDQNTTDRVDGSVEESIVSPLTSTSDVDALQLLYLGAVELNSQIEHILSIATLIRHKKYFSKTQATLPSLIETFLTCASYPVQLFGMADLQKIIAVGVAWNNEVTLACKPNAPLLSLNRLESLIAEGENLPIDFAKELDALREKRGAGKVWLDKFRKSMSTNVSRASREGGGGDGSGGKMDLQSMKKLIEEGGQLYEDRKNKELGKAMNVVDDAEDMINRVKDIISGGASSEVATDDDNDEEDETRDLELLKELLKETENMPVAMEEVQLLRAHIETVEWAEKARPILNMTDDVDGDAKKRYKVSTLIKLQKDLLKTRNNMSADMKKQFQAIKFKLPEETKLLDVIAKIEKLQGKIRKRFTSCGSGSDDLISRNATLRGSVTLSALRQIIIDMNEILELVNLDLDSESEHLHTHVNAAEEWLQTHQGTLSKLGIKVTSLSPVSVSGSATDDDDDDDDNGNEDDTVQSDDNTQRDHAESKCTDDLGVSVGEVHETVLESTRCNSINVTPPDDIPSNFNNESSVNILDSIDTIDIETLVDYDTLRDLFSGNAENVSSCFPELLAAKRRLEDVDAWLEDVKNYQPKRDEESANIVVDDKKPGVITSSDLEGMISSGLDYKVNLLDEMKRVREWIRMAEKWEVDAQPAFESILESVSDAVRTLQKALAPSKNRNSDTALVDNVLATASGGSYVRIPFLEGLENSLDEFSDSFTLTPEDMHNCLKIPTTVSPTSSPSAQGDINPDTVVFSTPQHLEKALQPIIQLHQSVTDRMNELMTKRRQQVGGIVLTSTPTSHASTDATCGGHTANLGILLETLSYLMKWIQRVSRLLTVPNDALRLEYGCQWGDISDDMIDQALRDVGKIISLDQLEAANGDHYEGTLLHSSIPSQYFYDSPSTMEASNENDCNIGNDDSNMDVDDSLGSDCEDSTSSPRNSPRKSSPRSNKKRRSLDANEVDSNDKRVLNNKDFTFEKHSTRKSKKKSTGGVSETGLFGIDADALAESASPVGSFIYSLYHDYSYPQYQSVHLSSVIRDAFRPNKLDNAHILPSPILQLVDVWVRILNLLMVRKEEALLYTNVADNIVKSQLSDKTYKGVKAVPAPRGMSAKDPLYRPIWNIISFTSNYTDSVRRLVIWGTKRNIALRTRRVIDHRFGQTNLWLQIAHIYLSKKFANHTIITDSLKYDIKPVPLPLVIPEVETKNEEIGVDDLVINPFAQLLKPLENAISNPLKIEKEENVEDNQNENSSAEDSVAHMYANLFQNKLIPKFTLDEMQMFIQSAESGGGVLSSNDEDETNDTENKNIEENTTPLQFLKEMLMLPQPLLFRNSKLTQGLKDNIRHAKEWIEQFHRLQAAQHLQAAGASADNVVSESGCSDNTGGVNINDLSDKLIAEGQGVDSLLSKSGIDLSEYLDQIMQDTQVYCLCRSRYHGFMVGCDHCEDWLHGPCIGLTKAQAERTEKYTCLRCHLKASANAGFQSIASIVALWMTPEDAIKNLETKRYRVSKKVSKEEAELAQVRSQLTDACQHLQDVLDGKPPSAETPPFGVLGEGEKEISSAEQLPLGPEAIEAWNAKIKELQDKVATAQAKLDKAMREEIEIKKFYTLDMQARLAWNQWMVLVRDMLWTQGAPTSEDHVEPDKTPTDRIPIEEQILHATDRAKELGIIDFPDVVNILNSFRWVSFCYLAVNLLRGPATVKQLAFLLSLTQKLKVGYMDEKIIRSMTGLLNRTTSWKSKFKKLIATSSNISYIPNTSFVGEMNSDRKIEDKVVYLDESKAKAMYEEGTLCLSVRTRLRDQLRDAIQAHTLAKDDSDAKDSKSGGSSNRSRGAQKFTAKDVISNKKGDVKGQNPSSKELKIVFPAIVSLKTLNVGYYSSDEDDSDADEDEIESRKELSDLDRNIYRVRFPSQRMLNPIPQHQLSASVVTAMQYPPTLNPVNSPQSKSYQPNYRHIGLANAPSSSRRQKQQTTSALAGSSTASTVGKERKIKVSKEQKMQQKGLKGPKDHKDPVVSEIITATSHRELTNGSVTSLNSSPDEVVVTDEMMQASRLQVAQIMSSDSITAETASDSLSTIADGNSSVVTDSSHSAQILPFADSVSPPLVLPHSVSSTSSAVALDRKLPKTKKEKKEKPSNPNKDKDKVKEKDKEKKPRAKKDKDLVVKGDAKKAAIKITSGESKKRQRAADEKARALLESINTGTTLISLPLADDLVPKTMDDALKKGAMFVEMKRQKGVEALKMTLSESLKKRKHDDAPSVAPSPLDASGSDTTGTVSTSSSSLGSRDEVGIGSAVEIAGSGVEIDDVPSLKKARQDIAGDESVPIKNGTVQLSEESTTSTPVTFSSTPSISASSGFTSNVEETKDTAVDIDSVENEKDSSSMDVE